MAPINDIKKEETRESTMSLQAGNMKHFQKGKTTDEMDDAILRVNGHEAVLERQFSWISSLALAFSITNSWVGYLVR